MNILEVKNLCKTYLVNKRQNNVLKNVNFTVSEGEMTAVMGPSGSGKSTLLYTVSGMDGITSGEVLFCGKNITAMGERELADVRLDEMGFIFQQMYMLKNLTVLDNIILPAAQSKKNRSSRRQTDERGRALMRRLGIDDVGSNDINEVSGGQLQRACICRSMINNPRMIFADEPTGNLDSRSSEAVIEAFVTAKKNLGATILMVTHDSLSASYCDRVILMRDGVVCDEMENKGGRRKFFNELMDALRKLNGGEQL